MNARPLWRVAALLAITSIVTVGCESTRPTAPLATPNRPLMGVTTTTTVYASGSVPVTAWDPIFPNTPYPYWPNACTSTPAVGLNANWLNPHPATVFPLGSHPWEFIPPMNFGANWINAWPSLPSQGPNGQSWTKYSTTVAGVGDYVVQFVADNCSWIYLDQALVGVQQWNWQQLASTGKYPVTLNGTHTLTFIIFDGGGLAGGKFRLETRQSFVDNGGNVTTLPPPPMAPTTTTVSFGAGPFAYTGHAFTATASVSPAGVATIAYAGDCINAGGTCTATATYAGDATHTGSSATTSITITKATSTTSVSFGAGPFVYTGTAFTATASVIPSGSATIAYTGDCINGGTTCTATATYAGDPNHTGSQGSAHITITYSVCVARAGDDDRDDRGGDREKGHESGSNVQVRIRVCDAHGRNIGSRSLSVKAVGVSPTGSLSNSGEGNPGNLFRFEDGTYRFKLSTDDFAAGSYTLDYTIGGDPTVYHYAFTVRPENSKGKNDGNGDDKGDGEKP